MPVEAPIVSQLTRPPAQRVRNQAPPTAAEDHAAWPVHGEKWLRGLENGWLYLDRLIHQVLPPALNPLAQALTGHMENAASLRAYTDLPAIITDLLLEHPQMAALFQRAMQGDSTSVGNQLVIDWLEKLFNQGMNRLEAFGGVTAPGKVVLHEQSRATLAINLIAMFNLTTGYFLAQRAFASLAEGELLDPDNIARQKQLLHKVIRSMLIS